MISPAITIIIIIMLCGAGLALGLSICGALALIWLAAALSP